jgi:iron-sulfur cluster repair protein YtfE (RIC family)
MKHVHLIALLGATTFGAWHSPLVAQQAVTEVSVDMKTIEIPESIQREHEAIHSALVEGTRATGRVGAAAKALADVLHPHFVREEEIALPPLGLLAPLAAGEPLPETTLAEAAEMTSALRTEMPRMLEEHARIRAAVAELRAAARAEGATVQEELAAELALHAQTEEEVLYPAAMLVGDLIRARRQ